MMKISMKHSNSSNRFPGFYLATTLAFWVVVLGSAATHTSCSAEQESPSAEEILDRFITATGGKEACDKIKNRVTKGTMEIAGQGIKLSGTLYAAKPNLVRTLLESDVTGKIESGTDGSVVWENSLMRGPAIKKGTERSDGLRDSTFDRFVYWNTGYGKAECVGKQDVEGSSCFEIVLTPKRPKTSAAGQKESAPLTLYINEKSNLITKIESKVVSAAGTIPIETYSSDYKSVDGIVIPHKFVIRVLNQERIMTISSIKHNVELPTDCFDLPDEIQALADKEEHAVRKP